MIEAWITGLATEVLRQTAIMTDIGGTTLWRIATTTMTERTIIIAKNRRLDMNLLGGVISTRPVGTSGVMIRIVTDTKMIKTIETQHYFL